MDRKQSRVKMSPLTTRLSISDVFQLTVVAADIQGVVRCFENLTDKLKPPHSFRTLHQR